MTGQSRSTRLLIGGGAAACAVCCAPPALALLGIAGAGAAATAATLLFAGVTFGLMVAAMSLSAVILRRKRGSRLRSHRAPLAESAHEPRRLPDPVRRGGDG